MISVSSSVCDTHVSLQNERNSLWPNDNRVARNRSPSLGNGTFHGRRVMCSGAPACGIDEMPRMRPHTRDSG